MSSTINEEQVKSLKSLFNEGFDDFLVQYFDDFEKKEKELSLNIQKNEITSIQKIAHALRGNSLNVGATVLADKCTALESACVNNNKQEIVDLHLELVELYPSYKQTYLNIVSTL